MAVLIAVCLNNFRSLETMSCFKVSVLEITLAQPCAACKKSNPILRKHRIRDDKYRKYVLCILVKYHGNTLDSQTLPVEAAKKKEE